MGRTRPPQNSTVVTLRDDESNSELIVQGVVIAHVSSREAKGRSALRWTELSIYKCDDGGYVAHEAGLSEKPGETARSRAQRCVDGRATYTAFTSWRGYLTLLMSDVLQQATENDPEFGETLGDALEVEDLAIPRGFSPLLLAPAAPPIRPFTVLRDNDRSLRFEGWFLGRGSSYVPGSRQWTEIAVYRALDGRIVATKEQFTNGVDAPERAATILVDDAASVVRAFSREGVGWVEAALLDALSEAQKKDERIRREVGDAPLAEWAHILVGSTKVRKGDLRYRSLRKLAQGAFIVSQDDVNSKPRVIGWKNDRGEYLALPNQAFLTLSRERLIRIAAQPAPDTFEWTISAKGLDTLDDANRT
jgi:hypothetical protein